MDKKTINVIVIAVVFIMFCIAAFLAYSKTDGWGYFLFTAVYLFFITDLEDEE